MNSVPEFNLAKCLLKEQVKSEANKCLLQWLVIVYTSKSITDYVKYSYRQPNNLDKIDQ